MPQVASETPVPSRPLPPAQANSARPSQANGGNSPFASLIDDSPPPPARDQAPSPQAPSQDAATSQPPAQSQTDNKPQQADNDAKSNKPTDKNATNDSKAASTDAKNPQAGTKSETKTDTKASDVSNRTSPGQTDGTAKLDPLPAGDGKKADKDKTAKTDTSSKAAASGTPAAPDPTAAQTSVQQGQVNAQGQGQANTPVAVVVAAVAQNETSPEQARGDTDKASSNVKTPVVTAAAGIDKIGGATASQSTQTGPSAQAAQAAQATPDPAPAVNGNPQVVPGPDGNQKAADQKSVAAARGEKPVDFHRITLPDASGNATATTQNTPAPSTPNAANNLSVPTPANQPATQAATTTPVAPAPPAPAAPVPLAGVAVAIAARASAGKNSFAIRLDPPELGRVDVRLSVDKDGRITSHLVADRQDTLALLQRDASGLQRALQDAGFKTADNGLQFSLRDSFVGQQQQQQQQQQSSGGTAGHIVLNDETRSSEAIPSGYGRYLGRVGGVDIRV